MSTPQFVDISQWQPQQIDWNAYKSWAASFDGVSRVAMRSSYGVGYKDAHFDAYRAGALAVEIDSIIFYHYSYPQINNPIDEANSQFAIVGSMRPQDIVILDFEENTPSATSAWAYQWLAQQEANYGKLPGIYASSAYIAQHLQDARLAQFPLWLANWQFTPDEHPPVPAPWSTYEFVQYTDNASIPGIPENVDADIFLGVEQQPQEDPMTIDLNTPGVGTFFKATSDPNVWQCIQTGFLVGHGMLGFYQKFGGDGLCGLTYLGLPKSNELSVAGHPGVTEQEFERGTARWDPNHVMSDPPGSGPVYLPQVMEDRRVVALQAEITNLQTLLNASNLGQVASLAQQIDDDVALIMKLVQPQ